MTHSGLEAHVRTMRPAAIAIVLFLGAAAPVVAGEPAFVAPTPAPNAPPYPGTTPAKAPPVFPGAPARSAEPGVSPDARAYAPAPATASVPAASTTAVAAPKGRAEAGRQGHGRVCLSQAETRDKIAQNHLADPVRAMRAGRDEGEVLRTRLCRGKGDDFVYVIFVLRRDGHVVRLYMNAQNGDAESAADAAEHR